MLPTNATASIWLQLRTCLPNVVGEEAHSEGLLQNSLCKALRAFTTRDHHHQTHGLVCIPEKSTAARVDVAKARSTTNARMQDDALPIAALVHIAIFAVTNSLLEAA